MIYLPLPGQMASMIAMLTPHSLEKRTTSHAYTPKCSYHFTPSFRMHPQHTPYFNTIGRAHHGLSVTSSKRTCQVTRVLFQGHDQPESLNPSHQASSPLEPLRFSPTPPHPNSSASVYPSIVFSNQRVPDSTRELLKILLAPPPGF